MKKYKYSKSFSWNGKKYIQRWSRRRCSWRRIRES